jgi:hypothetical protein
MQMTTRTTRFRGLRGRLRLDLSSLAIALVALSLPDCSIDRGGTASTPFFVYDTAATIRTAEGVTIRVTGQDELLTGGTPPEFLAEDADVGGVAPAERVRSEWKKYLLQRLSDPSATPEARAVFGSGPWCAVDTEVRRTEVPRFTLPPALIGEEIPGCTGDMVGPVSDCPMEGAAMPMLGVSPASVAFPPTPVGTTSPVEEVVTISNVGTGRICLAMPALDLASSEHPEYFPIDASGCMHAGGMREIELERTFLWDRRPSCDVRVRFAPGGAAVGVARLRLNTNDPVSPVTFIEITGTAQPGFLHPVPPSACFNTPAVVLPDGRTCRRNSVNLVNDGPGFVTVRSLALPADAAAAGWSHDGAPPVPRTVAPGAALSVPLLACGAVGADSILTVGNNGTASTIEVPLLRPGSGCTP